MQPAQKEINFTNSIFFTKGVSLKLKRDYKKLGMNNSITPDIPIFKLIRKDIEKISYLHQRYTKSI